jgi:ferredoxin-thioredoxin reductase catalytic subunit
MMTDDRRAEELYRELSDKARSGGYYLNPDREFTMELVRGLLVNIDRYGYMACPCRLAEGNRDDDLDIICPCDYRDQDLVEYGACYCGLYVSDEVRDGRKELEAVPERRPSDPSLRSRGSGPGYGVPGRDLAYPVYRCSVCGYLCARDQPPGECPICGVSSERFRRFM